jgi:hypothetical protein
MGGHGGADADQKQPLNPTTHTDYLPLARNCRTRFANSHHHLASGTEHDPLEPRDIVG